MPLTVTVAPLDGLEADVLAVGIPQPATELSGPARETDERLGGRLAELARGGELEGKPGEAVILYLNGELGARRLAAAGVGARDEVDADALRTAAASVARAAAPVGGTLAWAVDGTLEIPP